MVLYCIQVKSAIPCGPAALASYSFKMAWVLHFAVFLVGLWCDCTAMCCSNVSSGCSTCSLFNILCNRKLMNEGTATTSRSQNAFWDAYRHVCMDLCKMVIVLCCQRQNFELGMRKPDFCLSHLITPTLSKRCALSWISSVQLKGKRG